MTLDAYAPAIDPKTASLTRLLAALAEDAVFALATGGGPNVLEPLGRRRAEAYQAIVAGQRLNTMVSELDHWLIEMTRAVAPVYPPAALPMGDILREKVTLEVGARGLRSLFSSKPSDKEVVRVTRLGTLATRVLRAVFAADGVLDTEEQRIIASFIASLGLPEAAAQQLHREGPVAAEQLDVYGDLEPGFAKALLRGAWLAAAWDDVDPREEQLVRLVAGKLSFPTVELEALRGDVMHELERRRDAGAAAVEAIGFVLSERAPHAVALAAHTAIMMIPKRYRDEVLARVTQGPKITLARRHAELPTDDKQAALGIAWAAGLHDDPSVARRALLRGRHERLAQDLGEDGGKMRGVVDDWTGELLDPVASRMGAEEEAR